MTVMMFLVTVVGLLLASCAGITLCRDDEQNTGLYCVCCTLGFQVVLAFIFRDAWARSPGWFLTAAMFHQYLCFLPVMMIQGVKAGRKIHPSVRASIVSCGLTLMTWIFMADRLSHPHF